MTDIFDIAWKGSLELTENKIVGKVLSEGLNYGYYICLSDYVNYPPTPEAMGWDSEVNYYYIYISS